MKKISIVIPVFNTLPYLKTAVDSILVQKEFLHEVIIINDGSTDGSEELLENQYGKLSFVKIYNIENKGQGFARNLGTEKTTGDYIYYFDSDDISVNGVFKKFQKKINDIPDLELFCFSGESFLDENNSEKAVSMNYLESEDVYKRKISNFFDSGEDAFSELVNCKGFYASPPLYIFNKSILKENNFNFSSTKYEDEAFTHQLFIYAGKTLVTNNIYFKRRVRSGSTMQSKPGFDNILGYIGTVRNLEFLKSLKFLKNRTKKILEFRLRRFVEEIIILKFKINDKLTFKQRKTYYLFLLTHLRKPELLIFTIKYSIRKKLQNIKNRYFK